MPHNCAGFLQHQTQASFAGHDCGYEDTVTSQHRRNHRQDEEFERWEEFDSKSGTWQAQSNPLESYYSECFAGDGLVQMADGSQQRVDTIAVGDRVATPSGPASVLLISMSKAIDRQWYGCKVNGLVMCKDHPIQFSCGTWKLPSDLVPIEKFNLDILYDFELDSGHIVFVNEMRLCTFGHPFTINDQDQHMGWGWKNNPQRARFYSAQQARLDAGALTTDVRFALESAGAGCFAGDGLVAMADGTRQRVDTVEVGQYIASPEGPAKVLLVAVDHWDGVFALHDINGLRLCPEHPVQGDADGSWKLARDIAPDSVVSYVSCMYDFELDRGHAIEINGVTVCTLGHSFTINDTDSLFGWGWKSNPRRALFLEAQKPDLQKGPFLRMRSTRCKRRIGTSRC